MSEDSYFNLLKSEAETCKACNLCKTRKNVVFGSGNPNASILLVGEAPGAQEDQEGLPFIGRSGKLLTDLLTQVGLDRDKDLFVSNIVMCRPPDNRPPERGEIEACRRFINSKINIIKPDIMVLVGNTAYRTILNKVIPISKARGQWFHYKTIITMPIFHPSFLLRNPSKEEGGPTALTIQDLKEVARVYRLSKDYN